MLSLLHTLDLIATIALCALAYVLMGPLVYRLIDKLDPPSEGACIEIGLARLVIFAWPLALLFMLLIFMVVGLERLAKRRFVQRLSDAIVEGMVLLGGALWAVPMMIDRALLALASPHFARRQRLEREAEVRRHAESAEVAKRQLEYQLATEQMRSAARVASSFQYDEDAF